MVSSRGFFFLETTAFFFLLNSQADTRLKRMYGACVVLFRREIIESTRALHYVVGTFDC